MFDRFTEWWTPTRQPLPSPKLRQGRITEKENGMSNAICSVDGCHRSLLANGLCSMHYQRVRRHRSTENPQRKICINGSVATVELANGMKAVIDAKNVHLVDGYQWQSQRSGKTAYAVRSMGRGKDKKTIRMHRLILNPPDHLLVDHINGDGLDNRLENLRVATKSQNAFNRGPAKNNTSGFKGVSFDKSSGKWMTVIRSHGVQRTIGRFDCIQAAREAYRNASEQLHGEFSNTR